MANLQVSGGLTINLLVNGDQLNTTLNATAPLYQTFKKGTSEFTPNWATMPDAQRPIVSPRIYSVNEAKVLVPTGIAWKYNNVAMTFDGTGLCTYPDIAAGKIRQIDYNGSKALKMVGNVASDVNNDSDTITFTGNVTSSGQTFSVTADITLLVEEASNNLHRLFLFMDDDVIDGDETQLTLIAKLYNNGAEVVTGVEFEFLDINGTVLRAKNASGTFNVTSAMIDSELLVVCKAYVNNTVVATEQKQMWDSTDPFVILCDQGTSATQSANADVTYSFSLLNARTGAAVTGVVFDIKAYKNATMEDITSQFTKNNTSITVTGAKIKEHESLYVDASCTVNN